MIKLQTNETRQWDITGLTIADVKNIEEKDMDMLIKNIRQRIENNRINFEQSLIEYNKKWGKMR